MFRSIYRSKFRHWKSIQRADYPIAKETRVKITISQKNSWLDGQEVGLRVTFIIQKGKIDWGPEIISEK